MTMPADAVRLVAVLSSPAGRALVEALDAAASAGASTVMVSLGGSPGRPARLPFELADFDAGPAAHAPALERADVEALVSAAAARGVDIVLSVSTAEIAALARGLRAAAWHLPAAALLDLPMVAAVA